MGKFVIAMALAAGLLPMGCNAGVPQNPAFAEVQWRTADMGVVVGDRFVQVEYLTCMFDPEARWFEDGSAIC